MFKRLQFEILRRWMLFRADLRRASALRRMKKYEEGSLMWIFAGMSYRLNDNFYTIAKSLRYIPENPFAPQSLTPSR